MQTKPPNTKKAQLSGSNSLEVELQSRETEKPAESQELRKLFQCLLIEAFCRSAVFLTTAWSIRTGLALSIHVFDTVY